MAEETSYQRLRSHDVGLDVTSDGHLTVDGCDAAELAERWGTPLWVLSATTLRSNFTNISEALKRRHPRSRIVYASKANPSPSVMALLASQGALIDVASAGHVRLAVSAGIRPDQLILNGNCKTAAELEWAIRSHVAMINVDSVEEMQLVASVRAANGSPPVDVCLRLATDLVRHADDPGMSGSALESKFGMTRDDAMFAAEEALKSGVTLRGLHHHLGFTAYDSDYSAELDIQRRRRCADQLAAFASALDHELRVKVQVVNFGGGFRVQTEGGYGPHRLTSLPSLDALAAVLAEYGVGQFQALGLAAPELWIEPGGFIASNAGVFLAQVGATKRLEHEGRTWVFLAETSAYHFIRRLMFDIYHPAVAASRMNEACDHEVEIAGATCAPDSVTQPTTLPQLRRGDLVALLDQGAYCESVSTEYCALPQPATMIADKGVAVPVRRRRTVEDLVAEYR